MESKVTKEQVKAYFDAWREVGKDKRLRGADWPILLVFRDSGWDEVFLTQEHIGERVDVNRQTANRSLKNLVKCGHVVIANKPRPGTKKPVTYRLTSKLTPPTKYIVFMSQVEDMNMSQSEDMKKKKIVPVMSQVTDTNGINGNKVNGFASQTKNTHGKHGKKPKAQLMPADNSLPQSVLLTKFRGVREQLQVEDKTFTDEVFVEEVRNCMDYYQESGKFNQGILKVWLRKYRPPKKGKIFGGIVIKEI